MPVNDTFLICILKNLPKTAGIGNMPCTFKLSFETEQNMSL